MQDINAGSTDKLMPSAMKKTWRPSIWSQIVDNIVGFVFVEWITVVMGWLHLWQWDGKAFSRSGVFSRGVAITGYRVAMFSRGVVILSSRVAMFGPRVVILSHGVAMFGRGVVILSCGVAMFGHGVVILSCGVAMFGRRVVSSSCGVAMPSCGYLWSLDVGWSPLVVELYHLWSWSGHFQFLVM